MDLHEENLYVSNMTLTARTGILNFNLFGEVADLPDIVHCETIEARSRQHDWEFAPHRHARLHQILLLQDGGGQAILDETRHNLSGMSAINVPTGHVHGFSFSPGTKGHVVTVAAEIFDETLRTGEGLRQVLARPAVVPANESHVRTMEQIAAAFAGRTYARAHILRALCALILGQIAHSMSIYAEPAQPGAEHVLISRFGALIDAHYRDHRTVSDYARELAVTPTHLSRVCRAATGLSAIRLIEERIIREARRNLVYTNLPVSAIAYELGYDDPAYFSRVFSRTTGLSPRAFRLRGLRNG